MYGRNNSDKGDRQKCGKENRYGNTAALYTLAASVVRPAKELKDFRKITLAPGEKRKVSFSITEDRLCFLTENDRWESEPGEFEVLIGSDSTTENRAVFTLTGD